MSVISKNPFDLLGDDGDDSSPVTKPVASKKAEAPAAVAAPARNVPGAGTKPSGEQGQGQRGAGGERGRGGRYPGRGGPRNVYRGDGSGGGGGDDAPQRNTGPTSSEGVAQGFETPGGFDGERVAPSRKGNHNHIRDAHTKGPRGNRPVKNYTSGGHTASRGGRDAAHTPAQGGERRQYERRSGGIPDSQKKVDQGWGANEGEAELTAEVEGERDAAVEENAPATPGPDVVEADAAADATADTAAAAPAEVDPEENQKGLDAYLAERAAAAFEFGKKEGRQVNADSLEGQEFRRQGIEDFFSAKKEATTKSAKAPKKEKVYIEFDGQFATPPGGGQRGGDRPFRGGDRAERGRGGAGGERGGRGRGGPRGAPRGGPRGGAGAGARGGRGGQASANIDSNDQTAFPALGA